MGRGAGGDSFPGSLLLLAVTRESPVRVHRAAGSQKPSSWAFSVEGGFSGRERPPLRPLLEMGAFAVLPSPKERSAPPRVTLQNSREA